MGEDWNWLGDAPEADQRETVPGQRPPGLGHELRTPLNAILGFSDLLLETGLTEEQRRHVEATKEAAAVLLDLLEDVFDVPDAEAGRVTLRNAAFLLYGVIGGCLAAVEAEAEAKGLELAVEIDPAVPIVVWGDPRRLRRVLESLLGIAVRRAGRGLVRFTVAPSAEADGRVMFQASGNGLGTLDEGPRLDFEEVGRSDRPIDARDGLGFGTAPYRQVVEVMGGRTGFSSGPEAPPAFWIEIPLPEAPEQDGDRTLINGYASLNNSSGSRKGWRRRA